MHSGHSGRGSDDTCSAEAVGQGSYRIRPLMVGFSRSRRPYRLADSDLLQTSFRLELLP